MPGVTTGDDDRRPSLRCCRTFARSRAVWSQRHRLHGGGRLGHDRATKRRPCFRAKQERHAGQTIVPLLLNLGSVGGSAGSVQKEKRRRQAVTRRSFDTPTQGRGPCGPYGPWWLESTRAHQASVASGRVLSADRAGRFGPRRSLEARQALDPRLHRMPSARRPREEDSLSQRLFGANSSRPLAPAATSLVAWPESSAS